MKILHPSNHCAKVKCIVIINLFKKDYYIVLAGDFNARTGVQNDFINYDNCNLAPGGISPPPTMIRPGKSFDTHVNDLGKQLL